MRSLPLDTTWAIDVASPDDRSYLLLHDRHIEARMLDLKIARKEILMLFVQDCPRGWLRYGYFWDSIPFMNLLYVEAPLRGHGLGSALVRFWEDRMHDRGYTTVMTSTLASEAAQHLYRRLGYRDSGALLLPDEPLEIILTRTLEPR